MEADRDDNERDDDPLYLGLTRPPMFLSTGITRDYAITSLGAVLVLSVASPPFACALIPFLWMLGRYLFWRDPFFLDIIKTKFNYFMPCKNHGYWGCNSYDPW